MKILKSDYLVNPEKFKNAYTVFLSSQSFYANLLGKFKEGEECSLEALQVDSTKHIAYTNLAAALLFQGKIEEAEKIYRQYKSEFKDGFLMTSQSMNDCKSFLRNIWQMSRESKLCYKNKNDKGALH